MTSYLSNQKLWTVYKHLDGSYAFVIKLAGEVVSMIPVDEDTLNLLKDKGVI